MNFATSVEKLIHQIQPTMNINKITFILVSSAKSQSL
ncbi:uncharacterized protein METZ01_LOCUS230094 [marine metagenome]|uniref:Uncharacterized protein n=1 Tax=marine metagenome TaxID=408172 RepID=A0A382GQ32_9ZZZZ